MYNWKGKKKKKGGEHIASDGCVHSNMMSAKPEIKDDDIDVATVAWDVHDFRSENEVTPS